MSVTAFAMSTRRPLPAGGWLSGAGTVFRFPPRRWPRPEAHPERSTGQYVKRLTVLRRSLAMRDSSSTAVRVWVMACVVESAAAETPVMFSAI